MEKKNNSPPGRYFKPTASAAKIDAQVNFYKQLHKTKIKMNTPKKEYKNADVQGGNNNPDFFKGFEKEGDFFEGVMMRETKVKDETTFVCSDGEKEWTMPTNVNLVSKLKKIWEINKGVPGVEILITYTGTEKFEGSSFPAKVFRVDSN